MGEEKDRNRMRSHETIIWIWNWWWNQRYEIEWIYGRMYALLHCMASEKFRMKDDLWLKCWLCVWFGSVENGLHKLIHIKLMWSTALPHYTSHQHYSNIQQRYIHWMLHFVVTLYVNIDWKTQFPTNWLTKKKLCHRYGKLIQNCELKLVWCSICKQIINQKTNLPMLLWR